MNKQIDIGTLLLTTHAELRNIEKQRSGKIRSMALIHVLC